MFPLQEVSYCHFFFLRGLRFSSRCVRLIQLLYTLREKTVSLKNDLLTYLLSILEFAITIKDLVVQSIAIPAPKVQLVEPNIIRLKVSNFSASISCVVHYERQSGLVPLSDTVSAMITIGNSTLSASSSLGEKNGIPTFTVDNCEPSIGKIDIKLNGGASWLYSTIISMFSGKISEVFFIYYYNFFN